MQLRMFTEAQAGAPSDHQPAAARIADEREHLHLQLLAAEVVPLVARS